MKTANTNIIAIIKEISFLVFFIFVSFLVFLYNPPEFLIPAVVDVPSAD